MIDIKNEIWRPVKGYDFAYEVSNNGNVRSLNRPSKGLSGSIRKLKGKRLKMKLNKTGYFQVGITINGIGKTKTIHKLVAESFLNHKPCNYGVIVDHIDNCKTNNNLNNLQLVSNRYNTSKRSTTGSSKYVGVCWNKKLRKWKSAIQIKGIVKHIGYYHNELDASKAYQEKLKEITL